MGSSIAEIQMEEKLQVIHMCDFCSKEIETCQARPVRGHQLKIDPGRLINPDAVVACDKYESPVDVLKRQFH